MRTKVMFWVLVVVAGFSMGCAVSMEKFGWQKFEVAAGSAITGTNCTNEDGDIACQEMVWSEGFSEGLMGTLGSAAKGVVGFFVPGAREPQTVVVKIEQGGAAVEP